MTDFNFGFIGNAVEVGKHADMNIDIGPVATVAFNAGSMDIDFTDYVTNVDRIHTIEGSKTDFIWGQKWGNSKTRVAK